MAKPNKVERAFERCSILSAIVRHIRDDAFSRPTHSVWPKLGLVEQGETKADALARMEELFDELLALVEHLLILDMTAQFERASSDRVKNYIGSIRGAFASSMKKDKLPAISAKVIKDAAEFEGMIAYLNMLDGHIDKDLMAKLKAVRDARNVFAHGIEVRIPPAISREDVLDSLTDALSAM